MLNFQFTSTNYTPGTAFLFKTRQGAGVSLPPVLPSPLKFVFLGGYTPGTVFRFSLHEGGPSTALSGAACTQANSSGVGGVAQAHRLSGADCTQANSSGVGGVAQAHRLSGADCTQANYTSGGAVDLSYHLEAAGCTQANYSAGGELIPTVHRYVSAAFCFNQDDTAKLSNFNLLAAAATVQTVAAVFAKREPATPLSQKTCFIADQSAAMALGTCFTKEATYPLSDTLEVQRDSLVPTNIKRCGTMDDSAQLSAVAFAPAQQMTQLGRESLHPTQDTGLVIHEATRSYYAFDVPGDNYTPGHHFIPKQRVFNGAGRTPPPAPPARPFVFAGGYTPSTVFTFAYRDGASVQPTLPPPLPLGFHWNGVVSLHTDLVIKERGVIRGGACGGFKVAERVSLKKCSVV